MRLSLLLVGLPGLVLANPFEIPAGFDRYAPRKSDIDWQECPGAEDRALQCGRFEVPMDYKNETAGKASLAIIRYPAKNMAQPKLGTLFLNPGGPGESGVKFLSSTLKEKISDATNGRYDLVSWDPRGVGFTTPKIDCFDNPVQEFEFWDGTIPGVGLEALSGFQERRDQKAFYGQVKRVDSLLQDLGKRCLKYNGDTLRYVGTAATVRDMIALHEHLGHPNDPINFWGLSYGTVIGSYFINMFPSRVGRVVLDGVMDPEYYASKLPHTQWNIATSDSDAAFDGFAETCAAAGHNECLFTKEGGDKDDVKDRTAQLINDAYAYKRLTKNIPGSAEMRKKIHRAMYSPTSWPQLAVELRACERNFKYRDSKSQYMCLGLEPAQMLLETYPRGNYSSQAISCADAVDKAGVETETVFNQILNATRTVSRMFGPSWGAAGFYCHQWPVRSVERYNGPWDNRLSNKILVIGNQHDPITPLKSAKSVAAALGDSAVLIEQENWGHTSLAMHSDCTLKTLQDYFTNNITPASRKVCKTDQKIFGDLNSNMDSLESSYLHANHSSINAKLVELAFMRPQFGLHWSLLTVFAPACAIALLLGVLVASRIAKQHMKSSELTACFEYRMLDKEQISVSCKGCVQASEKC